MQLCKYYPVANDRMGIIWTLSSIEDACVIEFGPAGTTHYAVEGIGSLNGDDRAKIYSTHMDQSDVTFGKYDRLEKAIVEIDVNIKPKYMFVMASSISSIIGADIESVCDTLKESVNAKLIPITTGGLKDDYNVGVEYMLNTLVKEITKDTDERDLNKYNIIGANVDKYNFLSDVEELKRTMKELFNKEANTIFTCDTSIEDIENAAKASLNIVVRKEGLKAAEYMKEKYNIPYVYNSLYGLNNMTNFIKEIEKVSGYELNQEKYKKEVDVVRSNIISLKRRFYFYEGNKKCAVFGDYDTAVGLRDLLGELGLDIDRSEVLYREYTDESLVTGGTEFDRMNYLKNTELFGLFGDGTALDMKHNSKLDLQVSNPNLDSINIYSFTPFIGFRGTLYIIERIMNANL